MGRYSFEGDEIQTYKSARGLEVSVTLDASRTCARTR